MKDEHTDPTQITLNQPLASGGPEPYETSLYWKVEIDEILAGNRASEIIAGRGSAADYLKTLSPSSAKKARVDHIRIEALNDVLDHLSLVSLEPYSLNYLLDLVVEFRPRNGFSSIVSFLKLGATAEANFFPVGASVSVDLHRKLLDALGMYFEAPPLDKEEPAFLIYVDILRQQLRAEYRGYAASVLLKLKVLRPYSPEFQNLISEHPDTLNEIVRSLSLYASVGYGLEDLRSLFYVTLASGRQAFNQFRQAAESVGGKIEAIEPADYRYAGQTAETANYVMRLFDGTVIELPLSEEQVELVYGLDEVNTGINITRLLFEPSLTSDQRASLATELFEASTRDAKQYDLFLSEIKTSEAELILGDDDKTVYLRHANGEIPINLERVQSPYLQIVLSLLRERRDTPTEPQEIKEALKVVIEIARSAFG